jgi:glycosyltransferase involved in cell wall biosynthesis
MISVIILTKNEQNDLPGCLESVKWCDDIHVFDSFSDDLTLQIAAEAGAKITKRKFDNYAAQRNACLNEIAFKYEWIFMVDADERIPLELKEEIFKVLPVLDLSVNGFRIQRKDYLNEKWLKHAQMSAYYIRLTRRNKAKYHREINEVIEVDGVVLNLKNHFDHYPFSKGFKHWLNKHNDYSSMEAQRWIDEQNGSIKFSIKKAFFSPDFNEKRFHQKGLYYKMPFRPLIKWIYLVIIKKSFLDGYEGITVATLQSIYEYFIVLKTKEIIANTNKL